MLGDPFAPRSFSLIAIHKHGLRHEFRAEAIDEAHRVSKQPLGEREDLTHLPIVAIDPADARDHDDAIWAAPDDDPAGAYETTVTMTFEGLEDGRTRVSISESGWRDNAKAQKASYGNCEGWTGMLCAMKAYVEHGINLRDGFYK